jgi:MFS family permease
MSDAGAPAAPGRSRSTTFVVFLLVFLTILNVMNFVDRTLITNLAKQIDDDPGIDVNNTEIGYLFGYGFALFYTSFGIFLGMLADRWSRPKLIALGLALWSALTTATGYARTFAEMAVCRGLIGVGEATLTPAALSMLGETVPPKHRAFASGFYYAGISIGAGLNPIVAAYLMEGRGADGWRAPFLFFGLIGVALVVPLLFLKDPRTSEAKPAAPSQGFGRAMGEVGAMVWRSPALLCIMIGASMLVYAQATGALILPWLQAERQFDRSVLKTGGWMILVAGTLGGVAGGMLSDLFRRRWVGGRIGFVLVVQCVFIPGGLLFYQGARDAWYFYPAWFLTLFCFQVWYGAVFTSVQELVPHRLRATSVAVLIFLVNLLGVGPGPLIAGRLRDTDRISGYTHGLTISMIVAAAAIPFFAVAAWRYRKDLAKVQA